MNTDQQSPVFLWLQWQRKRGDGHKKAPLHLAPPHFNAVRGPPQPQLAYHYYVELATTSQMSSFCGVVFTRVTVTQRCLHHTSYCFTKLPAWLHPRQCSGRWCPEPELSQRFHLVKGNVSVRAGDTHPTPHPGQGTGGGVMAWLGWNYPEAGHSNTDFLPSIVSK